MFYVILLCATSKQFRMVYLLWVAISMERIIILGEIKLWIRDKKYGRNSHFFEVWSKIIGCYIPSIWFQPRWKPTEICILQYQALSIDISITQMLRTKEIELIVWFAKELAKKQNGMFQRDWKCFINIGFKFYISFPFRSRLQSF